jgi:hypothetical protein
MEEHVCHPYWNDQLRAASDCVKARQNAQNSDPILGFGFEEAVALQWERPAARSTRGVRSCTGSCMGSATALRPRSFTPPVPTRASSGAFATVSRALVTPVWRCSCTTPNRTKIASSWCALASRQRSTPPTGRGTQAHVLQYLHSHALGQEDHDRRPDRARAEGRLRRSHGRLPEPRCGRRRCRQGGFVSRTRTTIYYPPAVAEDGRRRELRSAPPQGASCRAKRRASARRPARQHPRTDARWSSHVWIRSG